MKGFSSNFIALKVDVLKDRKIYCLQAHPCIFQPGNFTGWGSERVKLDTLLTEEELVEVERWAVVELHKNR